MEIIPVEKLEAGIKFDKPVYVDGENLLVPGNVEIRKKDIERLIKWGVTEVSTEGRMIREDEKKEAPAGGVITTELSLFYSNAISSMDSFFSDCRKGIALKPDDVEIVINDFYPMVIGNLEEALVLTTMKKAGQDELSQAAVNCMILSAVLGMKIKIPPHRLLNIARAALIHDLGMTRVPQSILKKKGKLIPAEIEKVKTHTVFAYRLAIKELGYAEEVGRIAMGHHERWDGKGYPRGLSQNKISLGARIISVTDTFVAMSRDRADRDSLLGYTAIRQILNDNSRRFDPAILKIFIQSIGIYPRGSIVILNNGAIGRIVQIRAAAPLRPGIQILVGENGRKPRKDKEFLDLYYESDLFITRAVDPKELVKSGG